MFPCPKTALKMYIQYMFKMRFLHIVFFIEFILIANKVNQ